MKAFLLTLCVILVAASASACDGTASFSGNYGYGSNALVLDYGVQALNVGYGSNQIVLRQNGGHNHGRQQIVVQRFNNGHRQQFNRQQIVVERRRPFIQLRTPFLNIN